MYNQSDGVPNSNQSDTFHEANKRSDSDYQQFGFFFFFPILMWSILIDLQDRPRVVSKASPQKIQLLEKEYETMHALHLLWPARCMRKNKGRWKLGKGMLWMIDQILH